CARMVVSATGWVDHFDYW
nr:immunoglobulin heavy chain junction region [Macaca mulatta]